MAAKRSSPKTSAAKAAGASGPAYRPDAGDDDASLFDLNSLIDVVYIRIGTHKVGVRPLNGAAYRWFLALRTAGKTESSSEMFHVAEELLDGATVAEKAALTAPQVGAVLRIAAQGIRAVEALATEIAEKNALGLDVPQATASIRPALTP
jgi:hypothetical protein